MNKLKPRQIDALNRVKQEPALQPFFFKKLKGVKWFDELETQGFFNPKHHSGPVETDPKGYFNIPTWPILHYLEQTAPELQQPENLGYVVKFLNVMREVTRSAMEGKVNNFRTWWYFAKITEFIPIENITRDDAEYMEYWLKDPFDRVLVSTELVDNLLPRLLKKDSDHAQYLAIRLVKALTSITWVPTQYGGSEKEPESAVKSYYLRKILDTHGKGIGEKLEEKGVNIFYDRISEILEKSQKDKYSNIWRPAIEDHKQNSKTDNVEDILTSALRDALLGYVDRRATAAGGYVGKLLASDTVLFQRVAIYVTYKYNKQLGNLVHKLLDPRYFKYHYQHEMYHMLHTCFSGFDENEKQETLIIIETVAKQSKDPKQSEDIQKKQQAYAYLIWLSAIKGKGCKRADNLYTDNLAVTKKEPEYPDFASYIEDSIDSIRVGEISPYSVGELLRSQELNNLAIILKSFNEKDAWEAPTRRGLAQTLKEAIKSKPESFENHLAEFLDLDYVYTYHLIAAYRELWTEKQYDNWEELLEFCWALLQSESFWLMDASNQREVMDCSQPLVVGQISELIKEGTSNDKSAFDPSLFQITGKIIEHILEKQEGEPFADVRNSVFVAINSPRGKCVGALINYALRRCRLADKSDKGHDVLWEIELQPIFAKQIALVQGGNYEFVTLFSLYLPSLLYLSQSWTKEQLCTIFDKEDRIKWICAMQGYTYINRLYPVVYDFLRKNNHLQDALDAGEIESMGKDKIIQQFVIAYFQNDVHHADSDEALRWLLDRWKEEEIRQLIWFIWTTRDDKEDVEGKLIPLWVEISKRANSQHEADKRVLSSLCKWSVFVDEPNEQKMELLLQSAPYADMEHNAYILIGELKRLVDSYPDKVAEILICMLTVFAPTYKQEDIEHVISKLYETNGEIRQKANTICDKYIKYGIEFPAQIRDANLH